MFQASQRITINSLIVDRIFKKSGLNLVTTSLMNSFCLTFGSSKQKNRIDYRIKE